MHGDWWALAGKTSSKRTKEHKTQYYNIARGINCRSDDVVPVGTV